MRIQSANMQVSAARARLGRRRDLPPERLRAPSAAGAVAVIPGRQGHRAAPALCRPLCAPEASRHRSQWRLAAAASPVAMAAAGESWRPSTRHVLGTFRRHAPTRAPTDQSCGVERQVSAGAAQRGTARGRQGYAGKKGERTNVGPAGSRPMMTDDSVVVRMDVSESKRSE